MNPQTLEKLKNISTATLSGQLLKRGIRNAYMCGVSALKSDQERLVGPAYTLRYIPLREDVDPLGRIGNANNLARRAIEECPAGAVLVVDARGEANCGTLGDILAARLAFRGVAGFVTDGAVRDADAIREVGLSVYCAGAAAPASPTLHMPADLQTPIACARVAVYPNDIIVADNDGVVVLPSALADEVVPSAYEQEGIEQFIQTLVAGGRPVIGTYPPNDAIRAEYREWLLQNKS